MLFTKRDDAAVLPVSVLCVRYGQGFRMTLRSAPVVSVHLLPGTLHDHITELFLLTLRLLYLNPLSNALQLQPPRLPLTI